MTERDPLEALARAWRDVEAPPPADALEATDARTRATVRWLRAAWENHPVPAAHRAPSPTHAPVGARWLPLACAAAWLALLVHVGWLLATVPAPTNSPPRTASARLPDALPIASIDTDRVELRHGSVRLVLLTAPSGPEPDTTPAQKER